MITRSQCQRRPIEGGHSQVRLVCIMIKYDMSRFNRSKMNLIITQRSCYKWVRGLHPPPTPPSSAVVVGWKAGGEEVVYNSYGISLVGKFAFSWCVLSFSSIITMVGNMTVTTTMTARLLRLTMDYVAVARTITLSQSLLFNYDRHSYCN